MPTLSHAIVRPPAPNFAEGLTTVDLGAPEFARALAQHDAYCAALERCGLKLIRLEPDPNYPDSTFVEDTAVLLSADKGRAHPLPQMVLTRPGAPTRLGEVESMRTILAGLFPTLSEIRSDGTLDGGDVCEAGQHFFIGISERTNHKGARQLAELTARSGYTSTFIDIRNTRGLLHLKSGIAYLSENRLVVTDELAGRAELDRYEFIRVDSEEEYAANCVAINEHVLVAAGHPRLERRLRQLGYQTIALEMSEFQKMDGGLSCLSLRF
jgi:dimethylargininase